MCHGGRQVEWRYSCNDFYTCLYKDLSVRNVYPGRFTTREVTLVFIELEAEWAVELVRMFYRRDNSLAPAKI